MNLNVLKVSLFVFVLVVESKGGLVGGAYERIKNTTTGLTIDVKNAWSYSKSLVTDTEAPKEQQRGFIGGIIHSAHERMHFLHEELWKVDEIPNDSGLLWNMYNRLMQRLQKAKHFILGDGKKPEITTEPPNPESILIKETMEKLFNPDGTRKIDEKAFNEAVEKLKQDIVELRKEAQAKADGEGLIDIRMGDVQTDLDTAKDKIQDQGNNGIGSVTNGLNDAKDRVTGINEKALDEAAKERDLLDASYSKLSHEVNNLADGVKDDVSKLVRR